MKKGHRASPVMDATLPGWIGLGMTVVLVIGTFLVLSPYHQPEAYHHFTDTRTWAAVPNAFNVLSNLAFLIVGLWGILRTRGLSSCEGWVRSAGFAFFGGVAAIAVGSVLYHWNPSNTTLLWDRLAMAWTFMALLGVAVLLHFKRLHASVTLAVLMALGFSSVLFWWLGEPPGRGDLRFYGLVQFGGSGLAMWFLLTSRMSARAKGWVLLSMLLYIGAKVAETGDNQLSKLMFHLVSGHTLKHILGAFSTACYIPVFTALSGSKSGPAGTKVFDEEETRSGFQKVLGKYALGTGLIIVAMVGFIRGIDAIVSRGYFWPWPIYSDYVYPPQVERVSFPSRDGTLLQAWWMNGESAGAGKKKPILLFFHGNGGNLAAQYSQFEYLPQWGYDTLALDYRGFGLSEGVPSRDGIRMDAEAALSWLKEKYPDRPIVVVGHSMGTVFALQLAARRTGVEKVVVLAPFTSFNEIGETVMQSGGTSPLIAHWIARLLIPRKMDSVRAVSADGLPPVLIVHGTADRVVPYEMGKKVFEAYRGEKSFFSMDGYGHENYNQGPLGGVFHKKLDGFLNGNR
jgi:pimeloyl-ACP methyl ester carboxylesterase